MDRIAFIFVWILVFTIPWANLILIPGIGTISRVIGIPVLVVGFFYTLYKQKVRLQIPIYTMLLLGTWISFTYFWSISPSDSEEVILSYARHLIMVWLIFQCTTKIKQINELLAAYIFGSYVSIYSLMAGYLTGIDAYLRFTATGFNPNDLAYILAFGIPMAWYLAQNNVNGPTVWLYRIYPAIALFAIFLTASRGGFIVAIIGLIYIVWTLPVLSFRNKSILLVLCIISIFILASYVPVSSFTRISSIGSEISTGSLSSRVDIWKAGLDSLNYAPFGGIAVLWGRGAGCFPNAIEPYLFYAAAHNVYLSILVELGAIGLLLFIILVIQNLVVIRYMPKLEQLLWLVISIEWGVAALTSNLFWSKGTWLLYGLLITHGAVTRNYRHQIQQI